MADQVSTLHLSRESLRRNVTSNTSAKDGSDSSLEKLHLDLETLEKVAGKSAATQPAYLVDLAKVETLDALGRIAPQFDG